ncbi:histidine phosphatase family protein [Micromonospora sp. WMMD714]|uniref:histidine phosphatase family protein n=1 Tax=Micromonospora sp. WMMD714 TaxID=3016097 RepID=UPI002499F1F2|nr:histidine phosphatase family protein [Micromonospora sp. WMMD714]WFE64311.1 phosphoglycerate mutase family protein [Micromonospora sp. WMMD714]
MRLVLFRHGETALNGEDRFQGQCDPPLSAAGEARIRQAARALAGRAGRWTGVYCSPQRRAVQTAAVLGAALGLGPLPDQNLRERHLGEIDGLSRRVFAAEHPDRMRRLVAQLDYRPPGGETGAGVRRRFTEFTGRLLSTPPPPGDVLVVTHGGVLNVVRRHLLAGQEPPGMVGTGRAAVVDLDSGPGDRRPRLSLAAWDVDPGDLPLHQPLQRRSTT